MKLVWKAPSLTMNPTLDAGKIAAAIAEDPETAQAEWGADWRAGIASHLDPELIDASVRTEPLIIPPIADVVYFAGVDPSGGGADAFAWSIAHRKGERVVVDLVAARARRGRVPLDLDAAVRECAADLRRYGLQTCTGDRYAGAWVADSFARHRIHYRYAERSKSELYLELLPLVTASRLEIPDDPEVIREMKLLQRRRGAAGKDMVDHAAGSKDDRINALTLAAVEAAGAAFPLPGSLMDYAAFSEPLLAAQAPLTASPPPWALEPASPPPWELD